MAKTNLVSKISAKTIMGNVKQLVPKDDVVEGKVTVDRNGQSVDLLRVVGFATGTVVGESNFGPWLAFKGTFSATRLDTGEIFRSGKLFLPDTASDLLAGMVQSSDGAVEFAFDIGVKRDDEAQIGYVYTVKPLLEIAENDPVAMLMARLSAPQLTSTVVEHTEEVFQEFDDKSKTKVKKIA